MPPIDWPAAADILRVVTFQDYNTRIVILGATLLGLAAGLSGTFLLLRKRALLSDALSHATLPGIALAFILMTLIFGNGKHLLGLILGAAVFSVIGTASVLFIQKNTRLKDDAALGIVLSVYFGLGVALMGLATRMENANAAGLSSFIYGKTASMLLFDAVLIAVCALTAALFCLLFFKEFALICFDADYGASQGWPVAVLDFLMMSIVVVVTVIGLQAVGLILVVALLIIPAAAARFWTYDLRHMLLLSGFFGALSGLLGATFSALMANLPAGAVIVLTASMVFLFSLIAGSARGVLKTVWEQHRLKVKIAEENLLRDLYEWEEQTGTPPARADLLQSRSWRPGRFRRTLKGLASRRLIEDQRGPGIGLTPAGRRKAETVVRTHRLWETYLITHADVAAGMVDLSADRIEHILDPGTIKELESMFPESRTSAAPPQSPHTLAPRKGGISS